MSSKNYFEHLKVEFKRNEQERARKEAEKNIIVYRWYTGDHEGFRGKYVSGSSYLSTMEANDIELGSCYWGTGSAYIGGICTKVINESDKDVCIADGYDTPACGYADSIWCPAGKGIIRVTSGGPRDFAKWRVVTIEEVLERFERVRVIKSVDSDKIIVDLSK